MFLLHKPFGSVPSAGAGLKKGKSRLFYGLHQVTRWFNSLLPVLLWLRVKLTYLHQDFPCVAVVGLGKDSEGVCGAENWDSRKENIRQAVSGRIHAVVSSLLTGCFTDVGVNVSLFSWLSGSSGAGGESCRGGRLRRRQVGCRGRCSGVVQLRSAEV